MFRKPWAVLPVAAAAALVLAACSTPSTSHQSSTVHVVYEIDGTARAASVTVETPTGTKQSDTTLPMTNKAGGKGLEYDMGRNQTAYISAQNKGSTGSVTCRIKVEGTVVSENTSTGAYKIATCRG